MSRRLFFPGDETACRWFARKHPGWRVMSERLSPFVTRWWVEFSPSRPARFYDWAALDPELAS